MRITHKSVLSSTVLVFCLSLRLTQAGTIASWTFENCYQTNDVTGTDSSGLVPALGPEGSLAWGHHDSASSTFSDLSGNSSTHALSANHWTTNDYFEFQTATFGFTNISISFDQYRSGTGPTNWNFEFSIDGSAFTVLTNCFYSLDASSSWRSLSFDLSASTALDENANVYFRIYADSAPSSVVGASRVDNFTVLGEPVPEPSGSILTGLGGLSFLLHRRKGRKPRNS